MRVPSMRLTMRGTAATILAAGIVTGWGLTWPGGLGSTRAADQDKQAAGDRATPNVGLAKEDLATRWRRLRAEYVRIADSLDQSLVRPDAPRMIDQQIQIQKAKAAFQEARLALDVADMALIGYTEGTMRSELTAARFDIAEAEKSLGRAEKGFERAGRVRQQVSKMLDAKGDDLTASDILVKFNLERAHEEEESTLRRCIVALEQAKLKHELLTKYDQKRRHSELRAEVEKRRSEFMVRQQEWDLAERTVAAAKRLEEKEVLAVLAEAVRSPGSQPPWERKGGELQEFLDRFEAKLAEARSIQERAQEKRDMGQFIDVTGRILDKLPKPGSD